MRNREPSSADPFDSRFTNPFSDSNEETRNTNNATGQSQTLNLFQDPFNESSSIATNPFIPPEPREVYSSGSGIGKSFSRVKDGLSSKLSTTYSKLLSRKLNSNYIDQAFSEENIDYQLLDEVISEALAPNSKWRNATVKGILVGQNKSTGNVNIMKTPMTNIPFPTASSENLNIFSASGSPENIPLQNLPSKARGVVSSGRIPRSRTAIDPLDDVSGNYPNVYQNIPPTQQIQDQPKTIAKVYSTTYNLLNDQSVSFLSKLFIHIIRISDNISGTRRSGYQLIGRSLLMFPEYNPFRLACFKLSKSYFSSILITLLIFGETCLLTYQMWDPKKTGYIMLGHYTWVDYVLIVCNAIYGALIMIKIVAFGFISNIDFDEFKTRSSFSLRSITEYIFYKSSTSNSNLTLHSRNNSSSGAAATLHSSSTDDDEYKTVCFAFMKSAGNVMDFIGFISFIVSTVLGFSGFELKTKFLLFRSLMCLKLLRICNLTRGSRTIQRSLQRATPMLLKIGAILLCLLLWFSIVSVQAFSETLRKQCIYMDHDSQIWKFSNQLCGGHLSLNGTELIEKSPIVGSYYFDHHTFNNSYYDSVLSSNDNVNSTDVMPKGFICPVNSYCLFGQNPNGNTQSFDNLWNALQNMFVVLSSNTFAGLLYDIWDTNALYQSALFFIPCVLVLTVWMVNILVACILDSISIYSEDREQRKSFGSSVIKFYESRSLGEKVWECFCCCFIFIDLIVQATKTSHNLNSVQNRILIVDSLACGILIIDIGVRLFLYRAEFLDHILNQVDLVLAIINFFILLPFVRNNTSVFDWLTFFQIVRVYRIMLAIPSLRHLWTLVLGNIRYLIYLFAYAVLLFCSTGLIYARFFEGIISDEEDIQGHLSTMSSFTNIILSLYIIMTSENWTNVVYLILQHAESSVIGGFAFAYFAVWFIFANTILINAFLDLIAENLSHIEELEQKWYQVVNFFIKAKSKRSQGEENLAIFDRLKHDQLDKVKFDSSRISRILNENQELTDFLKLHKYDLTFFGRLKIKFIYHLREFFPYNSLLQFYDNFYLDSSNFFHYDGSFTADFNVDETADETIGGSRFLRQYPNYDSVFFIIGSNNPVRKAMQMIVPNFHGQRTKDMDRLDNDKPVPWKEYWPTFAFELLMCVVTVLMLIQTCIMTPLYMSEHNYRLGEWNPPIILDLSFCVIFSLELLFHILADGLLFTPTALLMDKWGMLSFITLATLWVDFIIEINNYVAASQALTGIKSLRALRLLTVSSVTRNTFDSTLIAGIHSTMTAGITAMSLMIPYAIWGLNIFVNRLNSCNDSGLSGTECSGDFVNGGVMCKGNNDDPHCGWNILAPRVYTTPEMAFDSFASSLSTLFQITSLEGWTDVLNSALQSTGIDSAPDYNKFSINGLYVISFNIVSTLIILNLFLSEVINGYAKQMGSAYLTDYQVGWTGCKNMIMSVEPIVSYKPQFNTLLYNFFVQPVGIAKAINMLVYTFLASSLLFDDTTRVGKYYKNIVIICCTVFLLVHHVVMFFYGSQKKGFNTFKKYFTVTLCIVSIVLGAINYGDAFTDKAEGIKLTVKSTESAQKVLLCFFFIFLPRMSARLNTFLRFSITASKQFISLLILWTVLFLVFSIALNQTFGLTKLGNNTTHNLNFRTVPKAAMFLFIASFGEGWDGIMGDFFLKEPFCTIIYENGQRLSDCGSKTQAYSLFISWNILAMYLLMNIFVSIIVEAFKVTYHDTQHTQYQFERIIEKFKNRWKVRDNEGSGKISVDFLDALINDLEKDRIFTFDELSFKGWVRTDFKDELAEKAIVNGWIDFHATLLLVSYYNYFSKDKEYLRTFDDFVWRTYLDKYKYTRYNDKGDPVFLTKEERKKNRMGSYDQSKRLSSVDMVPPEELEFFNRLDHSLKHIDLSFRAHDDEELSFIKEDSEEEGEHELEDETPPSK